MARLQRLARIVPFTILFIVIVLALKLVDLGQALMQARPGGAMVAAAQAEPAPPAAPVSQVSVPVITPAPYEPAITPAERLLLQDLRGRRAQLDAREALLQQREAVLDAAEHRLTARIAEMAELQSRLEQMETARKEHDEANWVGLVKTYESMKPREAAVIFNEMEMPVLLAVMDRMKDTKVAAILGVMQPDRARMVTAGLAAMRTKSVTVPDHAG
jgi:flagellar motility protein MotE (MotC chaperone)